MEQPAGQPAAQPAPQYLIAPKHSAEREPGMEHIPRHPKGFVVVRILQLIFALICLGLSAYILAAAGSFGPAGFMIFVAVVTMITAIYNIVALTKAHKAYNYWAILAFEIFLWIFWLAAFAWMAAWAAIFLGYWAAYGDYYDSYYGVGYGDIYKTVGSILGAAAGIGALTWILYFVTLIMHSVFMTRHRAAGLGNRPGAIKTTPVGGATAGAGAAGVVPGGAGEKVEMQPQQPGQVYPQATGYSQQSTVYGAPAPQQQQQGFYPQQSVSPPPQQYQQAPPQQYQQPTAQQQQYAPQQQYPDHSGQQPAYSVSAPSHDGTYQNGHPQQQMPTQTTGGSYVQGNPVAFPNSHSTPDQQPGNVHEAHGQSYDPHAPRELPSQ